jgi:hypothetical protein
VRRHADEIELAVYFSCLEALQNAAKDAGAGATATVRLTEAYGCVEFAIEDDGRGFEPRAVRRGTGLDTIEARVSAAGGTLHIDSAGPRHPGQGPPSRVTARRFAPRIQRTSPTSLSSACSSARTRRNRGDLVVRPVRSVASAHARKHAAPAAVAQFAAARSRIEPVAGTR